MIQFPPLDPEMADLAGKNLIFKIGPPDQGERLDRFTAQVSGLSRSKIRLLIDFGAVWVRGRACRQQSKALRDGDWVTLQVPTYGPVRFYEIDPARILHEDEWLVAYDKEAGLPSQQTPYDAHNNLFAALRRRDPDGYLALHHRLDRLTSGVMVFGRHKGANQGLSRLFSQGDMEKRYLAVVDGVPERDEWEVDRPIAKRKGSYYCPTDAPGRPARTLFTVLARGANRALVQARPLTGRTHQIRLHLNACGHAILGDAAYGGPPARRLMLHAARLAFNHPVTRAALVIEASPPEAFDPGNLDSRP
ncbi:MAG: RluA family pseudouridine synthase [Proteobacteria bacterium]|nr:RluA family pseudouridine synthase [Pseudomonadota bacterium]